MVSFPTNRPSTSQDVYYVGRKLTNVQHLAVRLAGCDMHCMSSFVLVSADVSRALYVDPALC